LAVLLSKIVSRDRTIKAWFVAELLTQRRATHQRPNRLPGAYRSPRTTGAKAHFNTCEDLKGNGRILRTAEAAKQVE